MSIEQLFIKEYQELSYKVAELEKKVKLYEIGNSFHAKFKEDVNWLLQMTKPEIKETELIFNFTIFLNDYDKKRALNVLQEVGIKRRTADNE